MKTVIAHLGNMAHAQHSARALSDANCLEAFVTTYTFHRDGLLALLLTRLPFETSKRIVHGLARRAVDHVPNHLVHNYPMWEILRTGAQIGGAGPIVVDALWDRLSHSFDARLARKYVARAQAIQGFEYGVLAAFERAKLEGVARILHLPSLDNAHFNEIQRRERSEWKELVRPSDTYFERKFPARQERRLREIALADVIIVNSSLTARSHIAAGAESMKTFVVTLGGPPPITEIKISGGGRKPLNVISAGPFSLRKGSHYLLKAWQMLNAGRAAVLNVYGQLELPERIVALGTDGILFHGSVSQSTLFSAYEAADVLVFPTLSDGFGMVVAEAMAHGLPVITTDQAGAADLVTPDNGILVPAASPTALADALRWCLDNRDQLLGMRFHALQAARRRQWPDFRRDLIAALDKGLRLKGYKPTFNTAD